MLHSRLPLHHRSSQLPSCPLRSSSRPCPLSTHYCVPAYATRRSLFACCANKKEVKADGRDGKPSWARMWTGDQDDSSGEAAAARPQTPRKLTGHSSSNSSGSGSSNSGSGSPTQSSQKHSNGSSISSPTQSPQKPSSTGSSRGREHNRKDEDSSVLDFKRRRASSSSRGSSSESDSQKPRTEPFHRSSSSSKSSSSSNNSSGSSCSPRPGRRAKSAPPPSTKRFLQDTGSKPGGPPSQDLKPKRQRVPSSSRSHESDPEQPSSKHFRRSRESERPGRPTKGAPLGIDSCLQRAHNAVHPWQCSKVLQDLGNFVRQDQQTAMQYSDELEAAASSLTATLLGSSSSSSSSSNGSSSSRSLQATAPFMQLDGKQLCFSVWGLAALADCSSSSSSSSGSRQLHQLMDGIAVHVPESAILDQPADKACMNWSMMLYSTAKLRKCQDSQPMQQLFNVAAQKFPNMLRQQLHCDPQSISNTLWAFATAEYPGSLRGLVAEVAHNEAQAMENAKPQGWSDTLWALGTMADRSVDLGDRTSLDAIMGAGAASMEQLSSRSEPGYISRSIWGMAKAGYRPHDSITRKLAMAVAEHSSAASPQNLSNTLWAVATLGCKPGDSTISKLATAVAECSSDVLPIDISQTLWALATLDCKPGDSTVSKLTSAFAERRSDAKPQELSNTLWALATLVCDLDAGTVSKLATAVAEHSSEAAPQALSNTLWALSKLGWYATHQISEMVAAFVQHQNDPANPAQHFSNVLQALGEMRWYDAARYSQLVEGVLLKIRSSAPDEVGQQLSNSMFSCALSCHFDGNVDALAEWGSQQSLQQWDEQALSNALYAWAILSATAGGDTASMRALAQRLFAEASRRGVGAFQARPEWRRDMGKLYRAHQEALHVCLPGGGVSDGELLRSACDHVEQNQQQIGKELSHITSAVLAALQCIYEVQASMIEGYPALLVHHPSCPRGIALEVTHPFRAYLRHPSDRLYGKTALRQEQMKRVCDGAVVCDGSEVRGKSGEQLRDLLVQRIEQAARD